jgi:sec-independent protein translocase protein TatB
MFDIGFTELFLIAVVALVVLGPEKLPTAVRTLGLWIGKAKRTISGIQSEISEELRLDELNRTVSVTKDQLNSELEDIKSPFLNDTATTQAVAPDTDPEAMVAETLVTDTEPTVIQNPQLAHSDADKKIINE